MKVTGQNLACKNLAGHICKFNSELHNFIKILRGAGMKATMLKVFIGVFALCSFFMCSCSSYKQCVKETIPVEAND